MDEEVPTPPEEVAEMIVLGSLVKTRAEQAYEMKLAGKTLSQIADGLGYRSTTEVAHAIKERFQVEAQFITEDTRSGMIQIEMDRLERLHAAYWESAMAGDREDAKFILAVHDKRVKIGQLDSMNTATQGATVLVISGAERSYVEKLKEL